jgi:imidazole glycerol phosphate synthase glutamine amidotransferase subunit
VRANGEAGGGANAGPRMVVRADAARENRSGGPPPLVAVVDYGAGNLVSIDQALTSVGAHVVLVRSAEELAAATADALIVPGVGAAGPAMDRLTEAGLVEPIRRWIADDRPYLGICLGLQLLFEGSDEDGATTFGILPGRTRRLDGAPTLPHIGWNQVERRRPHPLFAGIAPAADFYFVHSYAGSLDANDAAAALADTTHGRSFVSAIAVDQLFGVQFHPERSGTDGLRLLANFIGIVRSTDGSSQSAAWAADDAPAGVRA